MIRPFKQVETLRWFIPHGVHLLERPVGGREFFHHSTLFFAYACAAMLRDR
jgi:hypothetical protein